MPFVPFQKKSAVKGDAAPTTSAPAFTKKYAHKRKSGRAGKVAPAQKALMNPAGRSMGGGGR